MQHEQKTVEFPTRIGTLCTLPDGREVWVQTLNALQRACCRETAQRNAARQMRPWRPGHSGYAALWEYFEEQNETVQCEWLAEYAEQEALREAEMLFQVPPLPASPVQGGGQLAQMEEWEQKCHEVEKQRQQHARHKREEAHALGMRHCSQERVAGCVEAWRAQRMHAELALQMTLETLACAVRHAHNRSERIWESGREAGDCPDNMRECLIECYARLDSVSEAQIPTLPPDCCP